MKRETIWGNKDLKRVYENLIYEIYYNEKTKTIIIYEPMQVEHFIKFKKMLRNSVYEIKNIVIQ
jgi:hypothetical protein